MALFFTPAWQHKNPQKRIQALSKLPAGKAAEIIEQLAWQDPNSDVRATAIAQIQSPGKLFQLIKQSAAADHAPAAGEQLRQALIAQLDSDTMPLESRQRWLRNGDDSKVLSHLARYASDASLRKTALLQLDQQQLWQQCVLSDPAESNRALAVGRIANTNSLRQLIDSARKTDKKTSRLLQQTLEQRLIDEGDKPTLHAVQLRLCEQLDQLIKQQAERSALRSLDNEWAQISGSEGLQNSLCERYQRARRVFLRLHEAPSADTSPNNDPESATAIQTTANSPASPIPEPTPGPNPEPTLEPTHTATPAERALNATQQLADQAQQWLKAETLPRKKQINKLREQWKALKAELNDNELGRQTTELLSQLNQRLVQQEAQWKADLASVVAAIPDIEPQLEAGQLQAAKKLYAELDTKLQALKAIENRQELRDVAEQLHSIRPALQDLAKWQHWGNNRQRRELCERVEALIEQDIEPEALAEQIKAAQAAWKQLEQSETTRGDKRRASPALWHRFQTACRKAWEPCAEHFEQKKQRRSARLEQIEQTINELTAFADKTKQFDEKVLHTAVQTGYRMLGDLHRMPRKESRAIEKRLRDVLAPFQESQQRVQKQAAYAKRQLIEKAQQLNPEDNLKDAISSIKQLQAEWKKTGRAQPKEDRELWQAFRQEADRVFAQLNAQRQQEQQQNRAADDALLSLIQKIATLTASVSENTSADLHKLQGEVAAMAAGSHNRKLHDQLDQAVKQVKTAIQQFQQQQRFTALTELRAQAQQQQQENKTDEAQENAARDAVIQMEIVAGKSSPAADQARRLALQVDQLAANLGGSSNATDLIELAEQWYQNTRIHAPLWNELDQRVSQLFPKTQPPKTE